MNTIADDEHKTQLTYKHSSLFYYSILNPEKTNKYDVHVVKAIFFGTDAYAKKATVLAAHCHFILKSNF
jgi:hypothetical protein